MINVFWFFIFKSFSYEWLKFELWLRLLLKDIDREFSVWVVLIWILNFVLFLFFRFGLWDSFFFVYVEGLGKGDVWLSKSFSILGIVVGFLRVFLIVNYISYVYVYVCVYLKFEVGR